MLVYNPICIFNVFANVIRGCHLSKFSVYHSLTESRMAKSSASSSSALGH